MSVTLVDDASNFVVGNLVVVAFGCNADGGGGFAAPTLGGQSMTQVYNLNNASVQNGIWYREITGAESTAVTTCTDVGQTVGGATGFVIEIAAGTPATKGRYASPAAQLRQIGRAHV